jgi:DNA-directed RNA polymerase subunit RPC12/RpoP
MKIQTKAKCIECNRIFDLLDEVQAGEYYYGHDCEAE